MQRPAGEKKSSNPLFKAKRKLSRVCALQTNGMARNGAGVTVSLNLPHKQREILAEVLQEVNASLCLKLVFLQRPVFWLSESESVT